MDWITHLLYFHILLFVFWLGTDVGVFVLGKFAQNPKYSVEQRLLLLKPLVILDLFPRVCMVLIIPTGYQLATNLGAIAAGQYITMGIWLFSGLWLAVVLAGFFLAEKPAGQTVKKIEKVIHYLLMVGIGWAALSSIFYGSPINQYWIAEKGMVYVLIIFCVRLLESAFHPAAGAFMQLASEGSSPEVEKQIRGGMDSTYVWVIVIYVLVAHSAYLGLWQPGT
jgi:hypothetical protein